MAEMGALRILMELKAFDHIPDEGSISYKDLAEKVGAEENLLSRSFFLSHWFWVGTYPQPTICETSSHWGNTPPMSWRLPAAQT